MIRWNCCPIRGPWLAVCVVVAASVLSAQDRVPPRAEPTAGGEIVPADEDRAVAFAREHHPDLARLLSRMKARQPREYARAIRDLSRVSERLARQKQRSAERHEVELELWKAQSRLRLLVALSSREGTDTHADQHKEQIRKLLLARNELKMKQLTLERQDAESRLVQIQSQMDALEKQNEQGVDQELDRMVRSAHGSARRLQTKGNSPGPVKRSVEGNSEKSTEKSTDLKDAPKGAGASDR